LVPATANVGNFENADSDVTNANGPGTTATFTVGCDEERCDIGAGYYPMGTIGDFVWLDDNQNGMREPGEPGVANVMVEAYSQTGVMVASANTDADGNYFLDYLQAQDVYLKFTPPGSYAATGSNMAPDTMDSDIDNSNGPMTTKYYNIVPGEHIPNVDAGLVFGAVAVDWVDFVGENRNTFNLLEWKVTNESNVSHYEVQRSLDNVGGFETIGKVLSFGNSNEIVDYEYEDYDIEKSANYYYRIKQLDINGAYSYTDVITIEIKSDRVTRIKALVYPNPMVNEFTLEIDIPQDDVTLEYELLDTDGKLVRSNTQLNSNINAGKHIFMIDVSDLTPGIYNIRLNAGQASVNKKLIIVSN